MTLPRFIMLLIFDIFSSEDWLIYLLITPFTLIGTRLGTIVHRMVDVNVVLIILQCLVLLSTVTLCNAFDGSSFGIFMLVIYGIILTIGFSFILFLMTMSYRLLLKHPKYISTWMIQKDETRQRKLEEKDAKTKGHAYVKHELQTCEDGTKSSYTVWHA